METFDDDEISVETNVPYIRLSPTVDDGSLVRVLTVVDQTLSINYPDEHSQSQG